VISNLEFNGKESGQCNHLSFQAFYPLLTRVG
jgi:hypothetical protein